MQIEVFGLLGLFILVIFFFAETGGKKILGVFASLIMLMLGVWAFVDPISFNFGYRTTGNQTEAKSQTSIVSGNTTTISSTSTTIYNVSTNNTYTPASRPSFSPLGFSQLNGLALLLLSMFGMLYYGLAVKKDLEG